MKKKKINPCDNCEDINKDNDYLRKKSNYEEMRDKKLFDEAYDEGQDYDCRSCEHNKRVNEIYKRRIELRPKFIELYYKISKTNPIIIEGFKEIYRELKIKIDFGSVWDYKMFKFYISEYKKHNKSKKEKKC